MSFRLNMCIMMEEMALALKTVVQNICFEWLVVTKKML